LIMARGRASRHAGNGDPPWGFPRPPTLDPRHTTPRPGPSGSEMDPSRKRGSRRERGRQRWTGSASVATRAVVLTNPAHAFPRRGSPNEAMEMHRSMRMSYREAWRRRLIRLGLAILLALIPALLVAQEPPATLTLEEAIELARAYNPDFRVRANDEVAADWQVRSAYAALLPSVNVS